MNERIVILGGGESGLGAAWLAHAKGHDVFVSDAGAIAQVRKDAMEAKGISFEENGHTKELILNADWVVKSPGIPDHVPLVKELNAQGVPVISEIEFGYRYLPKNAKVIAITGTNGKTTTTLLTHHLLNEAGFDVALGGNIGTSLAGLIAQKENDYYVVEVSSFQLDNIQAFKPDAAIILNITPDHLDRYAYDFQQYVDAKFRLVEHLGKDDCFIYCRDSAPVAEEVSSRNMEASLFAISANKDEGLAAYLQDDHLVFNSRSDKRLVEHRIPLSEISLIGKHNMINTMAAVLSALFVGVPMDKIQHGLKNFKNAPHRLELVGEIDGVTFINDSKATNVDAVYYALDGVPADIVWMVGGVDKGNDYAQLMELVAEKVKAIICLGKENEQILSAFAPLSKPMEESEELKDALAKAARYAMAGDSVLLSPACASFDLFRNYEDRGDQFRTAVKQRENSKIKV